MVVSERPRTVGTAPWQLDGSICMPDAERCPGLVLIHGSGANDRDHRVGATRIFRDLAHGLAARGVAVLRYDKRTFAYRERLASRLDDDLTLHEEAVVDARAALAVLRQEPNVDDRRLFLFGYSLGGLAAPRVALLDGGLRGLVIAAATLRPLEERLLEQIRYLAALDGPNARRARRALPQAERDVKRIKDIVGGAPPLLDERLLERSPTYWLDLARHQPAAILASLGLPLLVIHPERDYQVTDGDLHAWRESSAQLPGLELRSYPGLNHSLVFGTEASSPDEHEKPTRISDDVPNDVARWIHSCC